MRAAQSRINEAAIRLFSERGKAGITVSELAEAAGVARGTIYNNVTSTEDLFEHVAATLAEEMHRRVTASQGRIDDVAERLANDIRFFVRRAHDEPTWGWFVYRFGQSDASFRELLNGRPMRALKKGTRQKRYQLRRELLPGATAVIVGTTLSSMFLVLDGHQTWRDAGAAAAELVLRSVGIDVEEAAKLAQAPLPPLLPDSEIA